MTRSFEFERGKGLRIDWQQEARACYGNLSGSYAPTFKCGRFKPTMRRGTGPLSHGHAPGKNRWHLYLAMRARIGHKHHQGIQPKKISW